MAIFQLEPPPPSLTGASNARGMKNDEFRPISPFISEMMQDRAIGTMKGEYETVHRLSNGAIFNDLERPLLPFSRSCHSLTFNISETVRDTDIVSMEY